jgi:hypothetical protein
LQLIDFEMIRNVKISARFILLKYTINWMEDSYVLSSQGFGSTRKNKESDIPQAIEQQVLETEQ